MRVPRRTGRSATSGDREGTPRWVLPALGAGRVAIGAWMLGRPGGLGRFLGVDRVTAERTTWLTRMVAAREVALGAGTLAAVRRGGAVGPWLVAQAVADAGDAVAIAGGLRRRQVRALPAVLVILAGLGGALAESRLLIDVRRKRC